MQNSLEILEWYDSVGVDLLLDETPVNRFQESLAAAKPTPTAYQPSGELGKRLAKSEEQAPKVTRASNSSAIVPDSQVVDRAKQVARAANTLEELKTALLQFEGCNLKGTAKNLVFADGNPNSKIMLIGEVPERDEDLQGQPIVGRAGQLLDLMLQAIGLDRTKVYITNVIPWRTPGGRTPSPPETEICRPFIERHIELINPDLIIPLGNFSAKTLLNTSEGITRLRGKWAEIKTENSTTKAMPILHPSFLLRQPAQKKLAWSDLLQVKQELENLAM